MKLFFAIAMFMLAASANAYPWSGHLARLRDAKTACADTGSAECLPYLAEAVAVVDVLTESAAPADDGFIVVFHTGRQVLCSDMWYREMNGESLLHSALGLAEDTDWVNALLIAAERRCSR